MPGYPPGFLAYLLSVVLLSSLPNFSQTPNPQPSKDAPSEPVATFQATTRMVTLLAKDSRGRHATGLTAADFQVFEKSPSRGKQPHEQKIAAFREVRMADLAGREKISVPAPEGTYTNLVTLQKEPVPPTILLVDGLNTPLEHQAQVHVRSER